MLCGESAACRCSAARCLSPLRRSAPQPANLPSMVNFMPKDMKPLEVIVHPLPARKGRLLFEPWVIALAEFRQRPCADLPQPAQVIIQLVPSDLTPRPLA